MHIDQHTDYGYINLDKKEMFTTLYEDLEEGFTVVVHNLGMMYLQRNNMVIDHTGSETFRQVYGSSYKTWFHKVRTHQLEQAAIFAKISGTIYA